MHERLYLSKYIFFVLIRRAKIRRNFAYLLSGTYLYRTNFALYSLRILERNLNLSGTDCSGLPLSGSLPTVGSLLISGASDHQRTSNRPFQGGGRTIPVFYFSFHFGG